MRRCEICGYMGSNREVNFHHYYPRPYRTKSNGSLGIYICKSEHDRIHRKFTNEELAFYYHDYESLSEII